jgi:hypothetical protein
MKKKLGIFFGVLITLFLLIPFPYTVAPEWRVRVLYDDGKPATGKQVYQMWTDSSIAMGSWMPMESLTTDADGFVTFPQRTFYAPLLLRGLGYLVYLVDFWSHASYGRMSYFSVAGGYYPSVTYRPGYELENTWIIRPNSELGDPTLSGR